MKIVGAFFERIIQKSLHKFEIIFFPINFREEKLHLS